MLERDGERAWWARNAVASPAALGAVFLVTAAACSGSEQAEPPASTSVHTATRSTRRAAPPTPPPSRAADTTAPVPTTGTTVPATSMVSTSVVREPWFTPRLRARKCPSGNPDNADCSTFTVAADRDDPTRWHDQAARRRSPRHWCPPVPDALVIPAGGPGYPGTDALGWADSPFNEQRDVVVYDQRGTGEAVPNLDCPANDRAFVAALQADRSYERERDAMTAARNVCRDDAEAQGIDLTDYQSEASATDLDELRAALGLRHVDHPRHQLRRAAGAGDDALVPRRHRIGDPRLGVRRHLRRAGRHRRPDRAGVRPARRRMRRRPPVPPPVRRPLRRPRGGTADVQRLAGGDRSRPR